MNDPLQDISPDVSYLPAIERPHLRRTKTKFGIIATVLALTVLAFYTFEQRIAIEAMTPDRFATFLGGIFAPLAFLWLVLGFFQQGDELRHSADALWLQGEELRHSVEQQRQLVGVTREQLQFESKMMEQQQAEITRNAQPIMRLQPSGSSGGTEGNRSYSFALLNVGKPCTGLKIDIENRAQIERNSLGSGGTIDFNVELSFLKVDPFKITVDYLDERLMSGRTVFIVAGLNGIFTVEQTPSIKVPGPAN